MGRGLEPLSRIASATTDFNLTSEKQPVGRAYSTMLCPSVCRLWRMYCG